jgi:hypothetical protein
LADQLLQLSLKKHWCAGANGRSWSARLGLRHLLHAENQTVYFSSHRLQGNQMKNYLNSHQRTIEGSFLILRDALQFRVNYRNQTVADVFRNAIAS